MGGFLVAVLALTLISKAIITIPVQSGLILHLNGEEKNQESTITRVYAI